MSLIVLDRDIATWQCIMVVEKTGDRGEDDCEGDSVSVSETDDC